MLTINVEHNQKRDFMKEKPEPRPSIARPQIEDTKMRKPMKVQRKNCQIKICFPLLKNSLTTTLLERKFNLSKTKNSLDFTF